MLTRTSIGMAFFAMTTFGSSFDAAADDNYTAMLSYLDSSIAGQAFQNASGISATNMAAGDFNLQTNLRAFAAGNNSLALLQARQRQFGNSDSLLQAASAIISGDAYAGGRGIASINQASGNDNTEGNAIGVAQASTGIREATDDTLSAAVSASAGGQPSSNPRSATGGTRNAAVESSAMRGYQGVLQLNQIAGSGNATGNELLLSVQAPSR